MSNKQLSAFIIALLLTILKMTSYVQSRFRDYYLAINKAELAICDSDFASANKLYQEAFAISAGKSFNRDLTNAFFAAADSKDYLLAENYFVQLKKKGMDSSDISKILSVCNINCIDTILLLMKKQARHASVVSYPKTEMIRKLSEWDQDVRSYYSKLYNGDYGVDSVFTADSLIALQLIQIIKKNGLPDECRFNKYCSAIILHHMQRAFGETGLFDTILYHAVRNLDFDARKFVFLVEQNKFRNYFQCEDLKLKFPLNICGACFSENPEVIFPEYFDDTSEQSIDLERQKIGSESLADSRKKIEVMNDAKRSNSLLAKYCIGANNMRIYVADERGKLDNWLSKKGREAITKQPLNSLRLFETSDLFKPGVLGSLKFNQTTFQERINWFRTFNKEYYTEKTPYLTPKTRAKILSWNYHTELVENLNEDLSADSGRKNSSLFVNGYRMIAEYGFRIKMEFLDVELLFNNDTLIQFSAHFAPSCYATFMHYLGRPHSVNVEVKKVKFANRSNYYQILKTKKVVWDQNGIRSEILIQDYIDYAGKKKTDAAYSTYQVDKYAVYLEKVRMKKRSLDSKYKKDVHILQSP